MDKPEQQTHNIIDTNSEEVRLQRGMNQYEYERTFSNIVGKRAQERYREIRSGIFKNISNVHGENVAGVVREKQESCLLQRYPRPQIANDIFIPSFWGFLDQEVTKLNEEKDSPLRRTQGFRLASITYVLGILIHQARDANGQTYRLISLSYIREFCPQWDKYWFPIKYSSDKSRHNIIAWNDDLFENVEVGLPVLSEEDEEILRLLTKTYSAQRDAIHVGPKELKSRLQVLVDPIIQNAITLGFNEDDLRNEKRLSPQSIVHVLEGELKRRYPGYTFTQYPKSVTEGQSKEYCLSIYLNTPEGNKAIREYVNSGNLDIRVGRNAQETAVLESLSKTLRFIEAEFQRVLLAETDERHKTQYNKELMQKNQMS